MENMEKKTFSSDLINFVACQLYGIDPEPIDYETANIDIEEWHREGYEDLPEDLTPESYMYLWNQFVEEEKRYEQERYRKA